MQLSFLLNEVQWAAAVNNWYKEEKRMEEDEDDETKSFSKTSLGISRWSVSAAAR